MLNYYCSIAFRRNLVARRVYWVGLLGLVRTLCKYWQRYGSRMPADLPGSVASAMVVLTAACAVLEAYDLAHSGGEPSNA